MKEPGLNSRREFLRSTLALGAMTSISPAAMADLAEPGRSGGEGHHFLFQGDSITDGNRTRNKDWNHVMGHGYAYIIASRLGYDLPKKNFQFFNRGISGNKVTDLAARWQQDAIDIKPNLLSILIGINDVSAFIGSGNKNFSAEQYETDYRELLKKTKQLLPNVQLVLCEPFILPVGKVKEKWQEYSVEVEKRQQSVKRLSNEFSAIWVPFQNAFNKALAKASAEYWIWDGIHPMPAGHELMAREWLQQVRRQVKFIR